MIEIILLITLPLVVGVVWWYQDNKREAEKLSDRLHNVENNVTQLTNVNYLKNRQSKK